MNIGMHADVISMNLKSKQARPACIKGGIAGMPLCLLCFDVIFITAYIAFPN